MNWMMKRLQKEAEPDGSDDGMPAGVVEDAEIEEVIEDVVEGDGSDFSDMADEFLLDDGVESPKPAEKPQEEVELEEVVETEDKAKPLVEEKPAPEPPPKEEEEVPSKEGKEEAQASKPEEEAKPPEKTAEELLSARQAESKAQADEWKEQRTKARTNIIEAMQFTEKQVEQLQTEPQEVLKEIAADLFLDIHEAVLVSVQRQLPSWIQFNQVQTSAADKSVAAFQTEWPSLDMKKKDVSDTINRVGQTYRQLNPTATAEQFIREVGAQASIALRIPLPGQVMDAPASQAPAAPAPHQPAQPSHVQVPASAPQGPWEELAEEFIQDDKD